MNYHFFGHCLSYELDLADIPECNLTADAKGYVYHTIRSR